ncbi:MAG: hypothetical protein OZ930_08335 [Ignavibacteria bacterium]|nr:hypothetical protein [Ignavibacteria bacterium]
MAKADKYFLYYIIHELKLVAIGQESNAACGVVTEEIGLWSNNKTSLIIIFYN